MIVPVRAVLSALVFTLTFTAGIDAAEPNPAVVAGCNRLFQGDADGAYQHFKTLVTQEPERLDVAYGVILVLTGQREEDESLDAELERRFDELIRKAQARYNKNRRDSESVLYLAGTYLLRARHKLERDKGVWGAARDGARSKRYSEEYVRLDPNRADGYLALGLYNYYADILPTFFKVLRTFLFLPSGSRSEGLKQLERAQTGDYWGTFAQLALMEVYSRFEGRVDDAIRLGEKLNRQYPENPGVHFALADLYTSPIVEDHERAAHHYATIVKHGEEKHLFYKPSHRYRGTVGLAGVRRQQWRVEEAIELLTPAINAAVAKPGWILPRYLLVRSNYRLLINDVERARQDAQRILSQQQWRAQWHEPAQRLLKLIDQQQKSGDGAIYAALIPGNRLVVERRWEEGRQFYERLRQAHPHAMQIRYRLGYLEFARGDLDKAAAIFSDIASARTPTPDWVKASSLVNLARIHDLRGRRREALAFYKRVVDEYGQESAAQSARLGLLTPYRRRSPATSSDRLRQRASRQVGE